jgi:hypothetical protein
VDVSRKSVAGSFPRRCNRRTLARGGGT